eukprot:CAMPEP_0116958716 /NCGR_PEP_ID=MMETSP0467-20121206/44817_1 /TAXON_ID=283647 /ORGANISM="Mesodinium pulex, Strain SPMC105" /LENGTH=211 /DNA_ID=CAMNT_0004645879 /DNA_START=715 /DNA_END=1352 /DNA_ORIENTATION=+
MALNTSIYCPALSGSSSVMQPYASLKVHRLAGSANASTPRAAVQPASPLRLHYRYRTSSGSENPAPLHLHAPMLKVAQRAGGWLADGKGRLVDVVDFGDQPCVDDLVCFRVRNVGGVAGDGVLVGAREADPHHGRAELVAVALRLALRLQLQEDVVLGGILREVLEQRAEPASVLEGLREVDLAVRTLDGHLHDGLLVVHETLVCLHTQVH